MLFGTFSRGKKFPLSIEQFSEQLSSMYELARKTMNKRLRETKLSKLLPKVKAKVDPLSSNGCIKSATVKIPINRQSNCLSDRKCLLFRKRRFKKYFWSDFAGHAAHCQLPLTLRH